MNARKLLTHAGLIAATALMFGGLAAAPASADTTTADGRERTVTERGAAQDPLMSLTASYNHDDTDILETVKVEAEEYDDSRSVHDPRVKAELIDTSGGDEKVVARWSHQHYGDLRSFESTFSYGKAIPHGELCADVYEYGEHAVHAGCIAW